ncbi:MAG: CpXC domain-containing protein [Planctomycetes bacterium]|nr:CpXC domain-containing protein [Planctomycetota bacterium]
MSRTFSTTVPCPECGAELELEGYASVNADRHPELREAILDGSLQQFSCACGAGFRGAPEFSYLDAGRKQWIAVHPYSKLGTWAEHDAQAAQLFDEALGKLAGPAAQEIGEGISPRVVFGWGGLREKLLAQDHGLEDADLECLKLQLFKTNGLMPEAGQELRLTEVADGALRFALVEAENERALTGFEVPRAAYDEVVTQRDAYAQLREPILAGCFVDCQKLFLG